MKKKIGDKYGFRLDIELNWVISENYRLALLSQYACCHMGFLIVQIVGNINEFQTACMVAEGEAGTDRQTDRKTET